MSHRLMLESIWKVARTHLCSRTLRHCMDIVVRQTTGHTEPKTANDTARGMGGGGVGIQPLKIKIKHNGKVTRHITVGCLELCRLNHTQTHTHTHIYIYIYSAVSNQSMEKIKV